MNILFLSELFYPHGSGGELATYLWAELLAESGFNVKIVTNKFFNEPEASRYGNMTIYRIPLLKSYDSVKYSIIGRFNVLFSNFIRKLLVWADVIYIPRFWYMAIPVTKAYKKPVIVHLHGYIPTCPLATRYDLSKNEICRRNSCNPKCIIAHEKAHSRTALETLGSSLLNFAVWPYIRRLVILSDAVICVSNAQKNMIMAHMPSLARKCYVIYNPLPEVAQLEINSKDMGYFGGLSPLKGFHVLYQALKHVYSRITIHATGFYLTNKRSIRPSTNTKIVFYERLQKEHYQKVLDQVSTVLVPSVWLEPSPYIVCEALLTRRLVIASEIGGIPELVEGCPGVFLVPPGDAKSLAEAIDYVNSLDKQTICELSYMNRTNFLKKFSNEKSLQEFIQVLERLEIG